MIRWDFAAIAAISGALPPGRTRDIMDRHIEAASSAENARIEDLLKRFAVEPTEPIEIVWTGQLWNESATVAGILFWRAQTAGLAAYLDELR